MKKITKMMAVILLLCGCFWVCSCGGTDKPSTDSGSDVEVSDSANDTQDSSEDSSSEHDVNGGNWTDEVPLN